MKMKLSDYVWQYIESLKVGHVFMFPGGGAMHLVDSLGRSSSLDYVTLLHEQACSFAAETYSRISNNLGVVLVTTGPGGTNAVTGCAAAWLESTPVIFISGQAKRADLKGNSGVRQRGNQEIGIVDIVNSITKYSVMITEPKEIKYHLDKAVFLGKGARPGPVWLDIPLDVQAAVIETDELESYVPENGVSDDGKLISQVKTAVEMLIKAKRPVLIAGQGIERNCGKEIFRKLVDKLQIPVMTSWIAVELLEFEHYCNMGKPGMVAPRYSNFAMQKSDLIIAVGTRLDPAMIGYDPEDFAPEARKIVVDIDKSELQKFNFHIELKIESDATEFLEILYSCIKEQSIEINSSEWMKKCRRWKQKYPVIQEEFRQEQGNVNPYNFFDVLSDVLLDDDVIIPGSSGAGIDVFWMCLKNKKNQRTLATGSLGSMGYGIPAAIGACIAAGKRTICVEGDGSLQLNIQELASISGMNLPIKIFVNNNNGYLSIMNMQRNHFESFYVGSNENSKLFIPDIEKVAASYGFTVYRIDSHHELKEKIQKVVDTKGPVLCNVIMSEQLSVQPRVMSRVGEDGNMVSGTLLDLWPFLDREEIDKVINEN